MATSPINTIEQVSRRRQAYESSLSEISAVPKEQFVVITLNISEEVTTVLGRLEGIRALGPQMTQALPKFPIDLVDKLETYTLALDHTQILYKTSSTSPAPIKALAKSAIGFREILLADVNALISRDLIQLVNYRLRRCDSVGLCRPVVQRIGLLDSPAIGDGSFHANLIVRAKGNRYARMGKFIAGPMVLQISCSLRTKVQKAINIRAVA